MGNNFVITIPLAPILTAQPINTIQDVITVMRNIDATLANNDGLKWFNHLYLKVTEAVLNIPPVWEDAAWLARLDVIFAQLYFNAILAAEQNPAQLSDAWKPLLRTRLQPRIARIQFALAGMNAHINHDLIIAVAQTDQEFNLRPRKNSPQFRDFQRVNPLLQTVEAQVKTELATGIIGAIDQNFGIIDDTIALWSVKKARETAWNNAEILWPIRATKTPRKIFLESIANLVQVSSQALLLPIL